MLFPKVILLSGLLFLCSFSVFSQQADARLIGDVDGSGKLDIIDALLMAQNSVGAGFIDEEFNLDVNRDHAFNIVDALLIAQRYVGLLEKLPAEKHFDEIRERLAASKKLWQSKGVSYYKLRQLFSCFCLHAGTYYDIYIGDGKITGVFNSGTGEEFTESHTGLLNDIDGLFQKLEEAVSNKFAIQDLEFDAEWGYPTSFFIDQYYRMADDEWGVYSSDFEVLPLVQPTDLRPDDLLMDWANILDAEIVEDSLLVDFEVSGGCGDHDFVLFSETSFAESLPVQLYLYVQHDGSDDFCEAIIQESRSFELSSVVDLYEKLYRSRTGSVVLNIFDPMVNTPGPLYSLTYDF